MSRLNNSLISLVAISATENKIPATSTMRSIVTTVNGYPAYNGTTTSLSTQTKEIRVRDAAQILITSNVVCFDVDSTVIKEEGIDELARYCGKGAEVSKLTKEAMGGAMTFQEALRKRLDIINPTQKQIKEFLISHPSTLSPGVKEVINHLKSKHIPIYLVTGGFDCLIEPIAKDVGIPMDHVFANKLMFYFNGAYAGFDTNQPTSRSGGKGEAISIIKRQSGKNLNITMIGDGATDLEASPPADNFIGYGGNVVREEVRNRSQYYVTDFTKLLAEWDNIQ
jgi:phosphoserine phosphatase